MDPAPAMLTMLDVEDREVGVALDHVQQTVMTCWFDADLGNVRMYVGDRPGSSDLYITHGAGLMRRPA